MPEVVEAVPKVRPPMDKEDPVGVVAVLMDQATSPISTERIIAEVVVVVVEILLDRA